jgi:hypothetical protein
VDPAARQKAMGALPAHQRGGPTEDNPSRDSGPALGEIPSPAQVDHH